MGKQKFVFYFRKNVLAKGDFPLYYRIASFLSKNYDCEVYCVNNSFPELQNKYLGSGINFCDIDENSRDIFKDAIFITAFNQLFFLLEEIRSLKNARVLLLFLHPQIIPWFVSQIKAKRGDLRTLMRLIQSENAYGFMDKSNALALEDYTGMEFYDRYFPVTLESFGQPKYQICPYVDKNAINIGWFGRMDRDKILSIVNFLDNLIELNWDIPINFHCIGDGNAKNEIKISNYAPKIRFFFTSYLFGEERDEYLRKNVDLVLAMGISALDVALLGIPTIIPIVSPIKFRDDKFVYIHDIVGYSLGWNSSDLKKLECKFYTVEQIVTDIFENNNKFTIGKKCYNFVKNTFSIEKWHEDVYNLINESTLTVNKLSLCPVIKRQMNFFDFYRRLRKRRNYADFLVFKAKLEKFKKKRLISKIKILFKEFSKVVTNG